MRTTTRNRQISGACCPGSSHWRTGRVCREARRGTTQLNGASPERILTGGQRPDQAPHGDAPCRMLPLVWSLWQDLLRPFAWASPAAASTASSSGSPAWPSTSRNTPSPSPSSPWTAPHDWKALESFAEYGSWNLPLPPVGHRPPPRPPARPHLARLPRLGRRRHQGPPHQQGRLGHLHLPRVHRPLPQPRQHRPRPQLGRPRAPCCPTPSQPARFLPVAGRLYFRKTQLPAAEKGPPSRLPHQVRAAGRAGPRAGRRPAAASTWASSTAASPCGAWCGRWSSPRSRASRASTS